ncbi:MAG: class I SAM-dependent methyltransferase [Elusimicrobia bacterium]|nr:class I SAM-dependent methyltransferase [Elusimicrobiota bacterium]
MANSLQEAVSQDKRYKEISRCRVCGSAELDSIIHLGIQSLTGVFPRARDEAVTAGPLELVKCRQRDGSCGLVQLRQSYDLNEMYGLNYGYRSGLNQSMVRHLQGRVAKILERVRPGRGDLVIDIGSNDSTLLQAYPRGGAQLVGIDPTGRKFKALYPSYVQLIPDFFSSRLVEGHFPGKKATVVTSVAMFYDLESPLDFMRQVHDILADNGIWVFEQSYLPAMMRMNAYDTICHEHLEYYGLSQIRWMAEKSGLKILGVELNDANGGSFAVTAAKAGSAHEADASTVERLLAEEREQGLETPRPYEAFAERVRGHREALREFICEADVRDKRVFGLGASTKGNVVLQYCGFTDKDIPFMTEVNPDKFGAFTPGTLIPIIAEKEARAMRPDYFLVMPWHFRDNIIAREEAFLSSGGRLVFPLPSLETVSRR